MAEEAHDESHRHSPAILGFGDRLQEPAHEHGEANASRRVGLRIEEDLRSANSVPARSVQVGGHEVVEVRIGDEDPRTPVVEVEEGLQVAELVRRADLLDRGVR